MNAANEVLSAGTAVLAGCLWRATWQGGLAILMAGVLCRAWRAMPSPARCWLWRLVYLKLLLALAPLPPLDLPILPANDLPARGIASQPLARDVAGAHTSYNGASSDNRAVEGPLTRGRGGEGSTAPLVARAGPAGHAGRGTGRAAALPASPADGPGALRAPRAPLAAASIALLLAVWLLGVAVCAGRVWRGLREVKGLRSRCSDPAPPALAEEAVRLSRACSIRRSPQVHVGNVDAPLLVGVLRPAILLPRALVATSDTAELHLVLAHEVAHLKRADLQWGWLATLCRTLLFFHPLVWWAHEGWQSAQEAACDELALAVAGATADDYGRMLVRVSTGHSLPRPAGIAAAGIGESCRSLKQRLQALQYAGIHSRRRLLATGAAIAAVGIIGLAPWRVVAQQQRSVVPEPSRGMAVAVAGGSSAPARTGPGPRATGDALGLLSPAGTLNHPSGAQSLAFSADGKWLASGAVDGLIRVWHAAGKADPRFSGTPRWVLRGHRNQVTSVAFNPAGPHFLASASDDTTVRVWDYQNGKPQSTINLRTGARYAEYPVSVAFSPNGTLLASGGKFTTLHRWVKPGTWRQLLRTPGDWTYKVLFTPENLLIAVGMNRTATWCVSSALYNQTFFSLRGSAAALSPDGKLLAVGQPALWAGKTILGREVQLWDTQRWEMTRPLYQHDDSVTAVAFSPDGAYLASASDDRTVRLWSVPRWQMAAVLHTPQAARSVGFSPDGRLLAVALSGTGRRGRPAGAVQLFRMNLPARGPLVPARTSGSDVPGPATRAADEGLRLALVAGDLAGARSALAARADLKATDTRGWTPLHVAAKYGRTEAVPVLLEHGADVNARGTSEETPLLVAAENREVAVAALLIAQGANVNARDAKGSTPLRWAIHKGEAGLAGMLLKHGADTNSRLGDGWLPLIAAASGGHAEVVRVLLAHGAKVDAAMSLGWTALYAAAWMGRADVVHLLLSRGARVDVRSANGLTPLHMAAYGGHTEAARALIVRGAAVNARAANGKTPLALAVQLGHPETARLLRAHGAR